MCSPRFIVGLGLALGLLATGGSAAARTSQPAESDCVQASGQQVIVYHAGSLTAAFTPVEKAFTCHTGVEVQDMTGGSVDLLRQVTAGAKAADIVATADYVDIDHLLKPANAASFNVVFARGRMVLAYTASGVGPNGKDLPPLVDPSAAPFNPPASVPTAVDDWYRILLAPGVTVGGSHPFLDPSGYRAHLMFQLAQAHYGTPNLSNDLLEHYLALPATPPANAFVLGKQYDFQLIYEHSAAAAAKSNPDHRYAYLPDDIDLSNPAKNDLYAQAAIDLPGLGIPGTDPTATIPATRVAWGLTVLNNAPHRENAIRLLQVLFAPDGLVS
jgi:molybdate/tungstate transport system substrate-binding protein